MRLSLVLNLVKCSVVYGNKALRSPLVVDWACKKSSINQFIVG